MLKVICSVEPSCSGDVQQVGLLQRCCREISFRLETPWQSFALSTCGRRLWERRSAQGPRTLKWRRQPACDRLEKGWCVFQVLYLSSGTRLFARLPTAAGPSMGIQLVRFDVARLVAQPTLRGSQCISSVSPCIPGKSREGGALAGAPACEGPLLLSVSMSQSGELFALPQKSLCAGADCSGTCERHSTDCCQ